MSLLRGLETVENELLGGSWVVISGAYKWVTIFLHHIKGLKTLLITTHEPPSSIDALKALTQVRHRRALQQSTWRQLYFALLKRNGGSARGFASESSRSGLQGSAGLRFNRSQCTHAQTAELLKIWNVLAPAIQRTEELTKHPTLEWSQGYT